jgi:hypothetical protein
MHTLPGRSALALLAIAGLASTASAQLRVANWNVSTYPSAHNRDADFQTSIYGVFQGRSIDPDIFIGEEFNTSAGLAQFLLLLNAAPGSPGDWAAAPWISGPDTQSVFFYRTSKLQFLGATTILAGSTDTNLPPRNINRFDVRLAGYGTNPGATLACYAEHMKSGSGCCATGSDQARRLLEAEAIRGDSNALPAGWHFLIAGDFNIQSSNQDAYQEMIAATPPVAVTPVTTRGQFFDPIKTPGSWNNSATYKFVHTQAPGGNVATAGGMDDRFDIILLDSGLIDGSGFDYVGNANIAYSTTTWNDPNHSFRAWGQDGTCFNLNLTVTNNAMVGATIAQAIINTTIDDTAGGHIPVFLDLRVPAQVGAPVSIDLGQIVQNTSGQTTLTVNNSADVAKWTAAGIATLQYSLSGSPGVAVPGGTFSAAPGATGNNHTITINTGNLGPFSGAVQILPTSADIPTFVVNITATIVSGGGTCYANCDGSTTVPVLNVTDFTCFLQKFAAGDSYANCDGSTTIPLLNINDFTCFLQAFAAGCP